MFASDRWRIAVFLCFAAVGLTAADRPDEPRETGAILLPGRLPWGATALPDGEFLAPCEDQSVTVLDEVAQPLARWSASARIGGPVTAAPRGPVQKVAVPLATGRVDVLVWDPQTRVLTGLWAINHASDAPALGWDESGSLKAGWKDGTVEAWGSQGQRQWTVSVGFAVSHVLSDSGLGTYAFGPGQAVLLDLKGRETGRWSFTGTPRGILQTMGGDLLCWTEAGLWRQDPDAAVFRLLDGPADLLGVAADRQDRLVTARPEGLQRLTADGRLLGEIRLPRKAVTGPVIDDRGRILIGTTAGLESWAYDGRFLGILDPVAPVAAPVLTSQGGAAWGGSDWTVHVGLGYRLPPYGWAQEGGGPGRAYSARRPTTVALRSVNWSEDPDFGYFFLLASSGEEAKQREVLDRLAAETARGDLTAHRPWASLVLLKIARSGLTDLQVDFNRITNNWPGNRLRAYVLLAQTAGPEDRDELTALLRKEFDPAVAAQGFQALARSGWDGDGKLVRLLAEVRARMPDQAVVADAAVDAARNLWLSNGRSTDPALVPLVSSIFQGPYPRAVKLKAQLFFQALMEAP